MADRQLTGVQTPPNTTEFTYTITETTGNPQQDVFYIALSNTSSYRVDIMISGKVNYSVKRKNQTQSALWITEAEAFQNNPNITVAEWAFFGISLNGTIPANFTITIVVQQYS